MDVVDLSFDEYAKIARAPMTVFDSAAFCQMNASKVEEVKFLVFNDGKNRFGLIAGIKDGVLRAPFSAPFACFSPITQDSKISSYSQAVPALAAYAKGRGLQKVRVTLPPSFYDESHSAKFYNSFYVAGFHIAGCDVNYHYDLSRFDPKTYEMSIDPKARQKLRAAIRHGLSFEETDDTETVYRIIQENRAAKAYPLWMSYTDILKTRDVVDMSFFLVRTAEGEPIAAAMIYDVQDRNVLVVYWGNKPGTDELKPMNYLAYRAFEDYKKKGKSYFDIGPSSEYSVPNYGLCDFKQAIGCDVSTKMTFERDL